MNNMTFEQKMGLLDKIVKELDKGNLSIEKIFEKYKDGIELCNELNGFIKELEGKVEYIESSLKGD
ncbi:exodeoxyribonuclease VII, small subunit [Candidatus Arthromitus sp. SFB-mouse-Japan]|nr:Hypothetical protein SFBmNL_00694 [Candidatus Arthromitus sp. SFB-mouse-NL]EIA22168.1 Putative Exonuclease VII small subunit exodeoxyribonuclease VII [Candidatus Arthromitus sp. SFB-1]EIA25202.1 Putative exodeoxyribonuclease [Candidatus Arthromitus sp. SFB-2]EIA25947.1 Exodeoxyribonuclease VII [Candidatus Arthromitus sp. SFB-4]EIA27910.1 Exodeoxyribonuclease VII, small subunit [Candidatus Arthromitus sp. SFB-co]EIA30703.1 Exodeoxyribonuclease VII, small subunit [Candidatus Arthromitus sp. S